MPVKKTEIQIEKETEAFLRKKYKSAGKTPLYIWPPTQGNISFYQWGRDPGHSARLRGAAERKARGTQSSTTRKLIK